VPSNGNQMIPNKKCNRLILYARDSKIKKLKH
jgi:hypothetical protein